MKFRNLWFYVVTGCTALSLLFHVVSSCRDPGYLREPRKTEPCLLLEDPSNYCPDCEVTRRERSQHCTICKRCVGRYDHHCPWINNCVGARNHNAFMLFLLFTNAALASIIVMIALSKYLPSCDHSPILCRRLRRGRHGHVPAGSVLQAGRVANSQNCNSRRLRLSSVADAVSCLLLLESPSYFRMCRLLFLVQLGNYALNLTTSERFSKSGRRRRASQSSGSGSVTTRRSLSLNPENEDIEADGSD